MAEEKTGVARWNDSEGGAPSTKKMRDSGERKRYIGLVSFAAILCVISLVLAIPPAERIAGGLYFKGGTETQLTAVAEDGSEPSADAISSGCQIIKKRLNAAGATESQVIADGTTIKVAVPADFDAEGVLALSSGNGNLEFIVMDEIGDADAVEEINQGSHTAQIAKGTYESFMDGSHVTDVAVAEPQPGVIYLSFAFDDEGSKIFADKTAELAEQQGAIAIALDRRVIAAASVSETIDGGGVSVGGDYTKSEAEAIRETAMGDKLGFDCEVGETEECGALLGDNIMNIVCGAFLAVSAVCLVVSWVKFKKLAMVVGGTVFVFFCLLMGIMAVFSRFHMYTLTIPGAIAACIASVVVILAAWRMGSHFVKHVNDGGTIRGGSISAGSEGLRIFIAPAIAYLVVGCVLLIMPQMFLRQFGLTAIYTVVAGVIATVVYGSTLLRLKGMGTIQEAPEAWGLTPANQS